MKYRIIIVVVLVMVVIVGLFGHTYQSLWKQVEEAQEKDLPKTAIQHLKQIEEKAVKELAYGQLLKATLLHARLQAEVAPDSLAPAVRRLEQQEQQVTHVALKAVYDAVLSIIYKQNPQLGEDSSAKSQAYADKALAHPEALAAVKATAYDPFVIKGSDSEAFSHDLLSVIGWELEAWQWMKDYYTQKGNRRALCHLALLTANTIAEFDSLSALYGDLTEAGVIAKKRQNLWRSLTNPTYQVRAKTQVVELHKPQTIKLESLRNLQSLTMRVYRTTLKGDTELNPNDPQDYKQIKKGLTELKELTQARNFSGHREDEFFDDSLQVAGLSAGVYMLEFTTVPQTETTRMLYFVSAVRVMMQPMPTDTMRYVVVDATSGQPLRNASLKKMPRQARIYAFTPDDGFCPPVDNYGRFTYYDHKYNAEHTSLFTDRSIYRPGQTVHVSAIVWKEHSPLKHEAVEHKQVKLELRDANYKVVAEQTVVTDRFGKCAADFTLPTGQLNGRFTIRTQNTSIGIRVEEYKRPTFQVEFEEYKQSYQQGDTVRVQAKATTYSGVPVQGAKVSYTVRRKMAFCWYYNQHDEQLSEGETQTADDGTFTVDMPLVVPEDVRRPMFYYFEVNADVTDTAGETHSGMLRLPLATRPSVLSCNLPEKVRRDQLPQVTFTRVNAAGQEIEGSLRYRIDKGKWQQVSANVSLPILSSSLKSGSHQLEAICQQDTLQMPFVVFSLDDKVPACKTDDWFYVSHEQFPGDGSPVTVQVGSSDPNLHIVYAFFAGNKLIESGEVNKNAALINRQFTYKEEYGNGLLLTFAWMKNGVCHKHQTTIVRPMPEKELKMTWTTFRDRLTPGQQEEWQLTIQRPDGKPADASLMAVLYDKSLDAISQHQWSFAPRSYLPQPSASWRSQSWYSFFGGGEQQYKPLEIRPFSYSRFDESVYPTYSYRQVRMNMTRRSGMLMMSKNAAPMAANAMEETADAMVEQKATLTGAVLKEEAQGSSEQLRENLQETAFCYPMLTTDSEGRVSLKFTLPESLTTWRFMGIAHTTDMNYGYIEGESVAKKDVMVQPNMPRFVRMGDEAQISSRIINTSKHAVSGQATLQLIDPETNQVVYEKAQPFSVEADKTATVNYQLSIVNCQFSLFICKIMATGDGFSDGEQHYLPVLPDREYVTKTVPYTQHEAGVKTVNLTALFPQGTTQQKLTVEYTNNPAWLMVQSLPTLGQPCEYCAIDQAASYYSNLLAKTLLAQSPQVKTVFEQWKREGLTSQLLQNEELKELLLEETPWVVAADRDTEQKQRLADFFDTNTIAHRLNSAVEKLQKLQGGDGSFSWYPGMKGSPYITMAVMEMLVRLNQMAGRQEDTRQMQQKAFDYLGQEMIQLVAEMRKQEKKGVKPLFPSMTALRWLYVCALDGRQLSANVKSANDYLYVLLKKDIKRQTIYAKAMTAVVLAKHGETKLAQQYVKSLKEYTVFTDEMGRYYDTPRASYSWYDYKIPTEVAAIEAIQLVNPTDRQTVDEMRRWLLQEKRTQAWDTPINSVNAIWAFLNGNSQQLTTNSQKTTFAIDGETLPLPQATAGIGYVKTAISEPQGKTFTATKTSEGTSWGAVYAQFLQKTSEVSASQSGISIKRELIGKCEVGSRVKVRITIETTRDLDFVQVADRRAACMEPVHQLSGYQRGAYVSPKDAATHYFYGQLSKGKHVIETEYYIDRAGRYETGTCTIQCAYAPEFRATAPSLEIKVKE